MKWYKHYSDMRFDNKIKKLIRKHGVAGYGVFNYVLENIAFQLRPEKPLPDMDEDAHDIATELFMDTVVVEDVIKTCLELELFQINPETKKVMCLKMLFHLDNTLASNPEIKQIICNFKKLQETSSGLKQIRSDKIRSDKKKNNKRLIPNSLTDVEEYVKEKGLSVDPSAFWEYFTEGNWHDKDGKPVRNWKQKILTWDKYSNKNSDDDRQKALKEAGII